MWLIARKGTVTNRSLTAGLLTSRDYHCVGRDQAVKCPLSCGALVRCQLMTVIVRMLERRNGISKCLLASKSPFWRRHTGSVSIADHYCTSDKPDSAVSIFKCFWTPVECESLKAWLILELETNLPAWRTSTSGMFRRVAPVRTDVSESRIVCSIRLKRITCLGTSQQ
jgi:hypothetical protein